MLKRICYTFNMGWRYRRQLKRYQRHAELQLETIYDLNPSQLKADGIQIVGLDFDGVLSSHDEDVMDQKLYAWLNDLINTFSKNNIFILTNKPSLERVKIFNEHGIRLIQNVRKKPYPDGLLQIQSLTNVPKENILLVDDRLLTGILAAEIAGIQARWITKPFINIRKHPFSETFFIMLRKAERWLI